MSSIYTIKIQSGELAGLFISLDATTEVTHTYSGKATQNPTANKQSVSDHYISNNPIFMFKGVISGVFNPKDTVVRDPNDIIDKYKSTIENAKLVTFFSGQERAEEDCFVEKLTITKDTRVGRSGWNVSATLNKIKVATGGKESLVNIIPDQSSDKNNTSASSTKTKSNIVQFEGGGLLLPDSQYGKVTYTSD